VLLLTTLAASVCLHLQGNVFTKQGANILLPYMTVAVSHYCLSKWQQSPIKSSLVNHVGEVSPFWELCAHHIR